ncbi:hypothetical protein JZU71_01740 [bacterium]|nr:hypothetical protein [bacterium]
MDCPTCSTQSFLKRIYGENNVLLDYNDDPVDPRSRISIDPAFYRLNPIRSIATRKLVHGHFCPGKYDCLSNAFRLTFLRHPVDNVFSIYRFWSAHDKDDWDSPVFHYFKEHSLSLERFAMLPKIRYLYSEVYFGGFDMGRFNFIGDYRNYDEELLRLGALLGVEFDMSVRLNTTQGCSNEFCSVIDAERKHDESLRNILDQDIRFYERYAGH